MPSESVFLPFRAPVNTSAIRDTTVHEIRQHLQILMCLEVHDPTARAEITKRVNRISALLISG